MRHLAGRLAWGSAASRTGATVCQTLRTLTPARRRNCARQAIPRIVGLAKSIFSWLTLMRSECERSWRSPGARISSRSRPTELIPLDAARREPRLRRRAAATVTGGTEMNGRGARYLELARRCRANAAFASTERGRIGLVRMAEAYDHRADQLVPVLDSNRVEHDARQ